MADPRCLANIKTLDPPVFCDDLRANFCLRIQPKINKYCKHMGFGGDVPVIQVFSETQDCYCCCSCFAWGTPIEYAPKLYKLIEDFRAGDQVLTTGANVGSWVSRAVTMATGLDTGVTIDFMYYCLFDIGEAETRFVIVTADHLFLLPDGTLKPIQELRPGDTVRKADGGTAKVSFAVPGEYSKGVRHIAVGEWEPDQPLDGHLINSNGLVTADLSVQSAFYGGLVPATLLSADVSGEDAGVSIGSRRYLERYASTEMTEFLSNKRLWPAGFTPAVQPLINIPTSADAFFTQQQAEDILKNLPQHAFGNGLSLATARYVVRIYGGIAPDVKFIIDWNNELPNAYYFELERQKFAIVTGGLARTKQFERDGLSIVMAHLVANSNGHACVGASDYNGVLLYLREAWNNDLFHKVFSNGMVQIRRLFDGIDPANRKADPNNICGQPSIDCRVETYNAAAGFGDEPACGIPLPPFRVVGANAEGRQTVTVTFSANVDPTAGETPGNYAISGDATVTKASAGTSPGPRIQLTVKGLKRDEEYLLTVTNVVDDMGQIIAPDGNTATFGTKGLY